MSLTPQEIAQRILMFLNKPLQTSSLERIGWTWNPTKAAGVVSAGAFAATAISAIDGTKTFGPALLPGVATDLEGLAVTGNASSVASSSSCIRNCTENGCRTSSLHGVRCRGDGAVGVVFGDGDGSDGFGFL